MIIDKDKWSKGEVIIILAIVLFIIVFRK